MADASLATDTVPPRPRQGACGACVAERQRRCRLLHMREINQPGRKGAVATYTTLTGRAERFHVTRLCPPADALLFSWPEASERRRLRCPLDAY